MNPQNSWSRELIGGIFQYANTNGPWHFWISPDQTTTFTELPEDWQGNGVIGWITETHLADALRAAQLPAVNITDFLTDEITLPSVQTDDRYGSLLAIEHFKERGISNVAFAGPNARPSHLNYARCFDEVATSEARKCPAFIFESLDRSQRELVIEWLHQLPKPVGILALGNEHARFIVNTCAQIGINVPHDVAVLSAFYDTITSHSCYPTLSGINTPTKQIGYRAAELLDQILQGKEVPPQVEYLKASSITELPSTDTQAVKDPQLIQAIGFIKAHAFDNFTMHELLREVPMARSTLERRFQKTYGRTVFDEVKRIRINQARKLLTETDLKMQAIAEACGYTTYNNLGTAFKQATGLSPSVYRKKYRC